MSSTGKRMRCVMEAAEEEEMIGKVDDLFSFALALHRVQGRLSDPGFPKELKQQLFNDIVSKASEQFSADIVLEMLIMVDKYYLGTKERRITYPVYRYLTKVVNVPMPDGTRSLLKKFIEGKKCRYDTPFMQEGDGTWDRPASWVRLQNTLQRDVMKNIRWIDSRCSNIDLQRATEYIKACFLESREEGAKIGDVGYDEVSLTESITVDLFCPLSTTKIVIPARARGTKVIQPFDLEHFLAVNLQRNLTLAEEGKDPVPWRCPVTSMPLSPDSIIIDPFFTDILAKADQSTRHVVVHKDGTWMSVPPDSASKSEAAIKYTLVPDTEFDSKYDVKVKTEPAEPTSSGMQNENVEE